MKAAWLVFFCATLVGMRSPRAQDGTGTAETKPAVPAPAAQAREVAQPTSAQPVTVPPLPPTQPPPLKAQAKKKAVRAQEAPAADEDDQVVYSLGGQTVVIPSPSQEQMRVGQWVYTSQYGWVYMPYGQQYVSEGSGADMNAYEYVYYPGDGWRWVTAPWIYGWGPAPDYGTLGADPYLWSSTSYWDDYRLRARPVRYDLYNNSNYYGAPLPGPRLGGGSGGMRGSQLGQLVGRTPVFNPSSSYVGNGSRVPSSSGSGSTTSFQGNRGGSVSGGHDGSSSLGGSSLGGSSSSTPSGGSHSGMGSHSGGSSSGHSSGGASAGHRR
jgi:hypothetical protein